MPMTVLRHSFITRASATMGAKASDFVHQLGKAQGSSAFGNTKIQEKGLNVHSCLSVRGRL
jgi:hypothetical protein